jgi:hypothetical protein
MKKRNQTGCVFGVAVALAIASCAAAPRKSADVPAHAAGVDGGRSMAPKPRIKDSAPENAAALRAADPNHLQLGAEDERFGIDAARERRRATDEQAAEARQENKASKQVIPLGPGPAPAGAPSTPPPPH